VGGTGETGKGRVQNTRKGVPASSGKGIIIRPAESFSIISSVDKAGGI